MRYGKIENDIVTIISFAPQSGFVEIPDDVFAGYICLPDGGFCPPTVTLEECKQKKLADITKQYNQNIYAGFLSDGVSYDSTPENQNRIMMAKISLGGMVLSNNTMVNLTATQAEQVFSDMSTYINSFNERYAKAQADISEATTNDQVNQVVLL